MLTGGEKLRKDLKKSVKSGRALKRVEKTLFMTGADSGKAVRALVGTTQAIDLIQGGVKVNALPEQTNGVCIHL